MAPSSSAVSLGILPEDFDGHNLVFIVGCGRSGTTWLQRLLASNPRVHTGQESYVFATYLGPLLRAWQSKATQAQATKIGLHNYFTEDEFRELIGEFTRRLLYPLAGTLGADELFVDKTPNHVFFMKEISEMLPKCRFVHMVRNGRDVTASLLAASKGWGWNWAPHTARGAARLWVKAVKAGMEGCGGLPKERCSEIRYESLRRDPEGELGRLCHFLGVDWDKEEIHRAVLKNSLAAPESERTAIPRGGDYRIKISADVRDPPGFVRKGEVGGWKKDLSIMDRMWFWLIARETMREVGYSCRYP